MRNIVFIFDTEDDVFLLLKGIQWFIELQEQIWAVWVRSIDAKVSNRFVIGSISITRFPKYKAGDKRQNGDQQHSQTKKYRFHYRSRPVNSITSACPINIPIMRDVMGYMTFLSFCFDEFSTWGFFSDTNIPSFLDVCV